MTADEGQRRLAAMLNLIVHRGPDGKGGHSQDGLAIGMRRLSIIDLQGGQQPVWNEDRTIAIVFNGEIYNYLELRDALDDHIFRTKSDTEVLVHLYEECGRDMLSRLRGMFAFALLDTRNRSLFLARDHFGQKPIYYSILNGRFAFASELKCLLTLSDVSTELDEQAFWDYVSWFSLPPPHTHFRYIRKLPAGSAIVVPIDRPSELAITKYWTFNLTDQPVLDDLDSAATALNERLRESVKMHLRADVPVGVLLSSGLDSRCISVYAQELTRGRLSTFSVGFGDEESEADEAADVANRIRSRHYSLELGPGDLAESIEHVAWHLDEPVADPAAFAVLRLCRLAREHVKVLLSGEGADELFAGYAERYQGRTHTIRRSDVLRRLSWLLPAPNRDAPASRWQLLYERSRSTRGGEMVALAIEGMPGDARCTRGLTREQIDRLRQRTVTLGQQIHRKQRDVLSELLVLDIDWSLAESLLQKADKMSMAASVELRTPFLDVSVADLAARINSDAKLAEKGPGKLVLRKCLAQSFAEGSAPPKKGFPVPLTAWFTGQLRDQVVDEVLSSTAACSGHLDRKLLLSAWDDFQGGKWRGERVFYALWLYEVWYRTVVRRRYDSDHRPFSPLQTSDVIRTGTPLPAALASGVGA
jgi:asparagine synthase (glutamine-hydrolysing)